MTRPLKFHQVLNQPPRSIRDGRHRRSSAPSHRHPVVGADHGAGGADQGALTVHTISWSSTLAWEPIPKPSTIPSAGIRTGELIGYRLWWMLERDGVPWISSLAHERLWLPGETIHSDTNKLIEHDPWLDFTIWGGVYAFTSDGPLAAEIHQSRTCARDYRRRPSSMWIIGWNPYVETETVVAGTVKMWGDVVEHERGYRAEFAKLNSLDAIYGPGDLDALREKYGLNTALTPRHR